MDTSTKTLPINSLFSMLLKLFLKDPSGILDFLFDILQRIPILKSLPGLYEVLDYAASIELQDPHGNMAIYSKREQVRFLQNNVIAYQDMAWGEGYIFADYQCSPGVEVDRYREGHRYNILISLRETKNRGDELTFHIKRTIHQGFPQNIEYFQTDINHRTHRLALSVVFPKERLPVKVWLTEQKAGRTTILDTAHRRMLFDGRHLYFWQTRSVRLYEAYILHWEW